MAEKQTIPVEDDSSTAAPKAPVTRSISFADMTRAKKRPDNRGLMLVSAEELGLDSEELGMRKGEQIALVFRPMNPGENSEIREKVKDFPQEEWLDAYHVELIMACLLEPEIPDSAEGRKQLDRWLPGTRTTLGIAIQNQSGMGAHTVKNAKEELGKLVALTPNIS